MVSFKELISSSKGVVFYIAFILLIACAGFLSVIFLGPHNQVETFFEKALDHEIEQKLNLAPGSVNIDLDPQKEDSK